MVEKLTFTLPEVAEMTGFNLATLKNDCCRGRIEHVYRGRKRTMTRPQIDRLIRQYTVSPNPATDPEELDRAHAARVLSRSGRP